MTLTSINPATGQTVWEGGEAGQTEIDAALNRSWERFEEWSRTPLEKRLAAVARFRAIVEERRHRIAETISKEVGKPYWESLTEVSSMIAKVAISIEAYYARTGTVHKSQGGVSLTTHHRPLGPLAIFAPFNFPGHLPTGQMVPALIAGNSCILKPSEHAPAVGELLAKCWSDAGVGVEVVQGGAETGAVLASHDGLAGLLFTGSARTGHRLAQLFGNRPDKLLALEMGGNTPLVIDAPSDVRAALFCTIQSAYATSGQRCTCARRIILPRSPENEAFVGRLSGVVLSIVVGPYTARPEPFMGPLISAQAATNALDWQEALCRRGAVPLCRSELTNNTFLSPGLLDVTEVQDRDDEEIFAPIAQLIWTDSFEEAVEEAARTRFGLAAGLLSDRQEQWHLFYDRMRAGVINWNRPTTGASGLAPFGGVGDSGNFRPAGFYMADSCAYPVASMEADRPFLPESLPPGLTL